MLVVTRKFNEKLLIGDDVTVTVVRIDGHQVRLGIEAPKHLNIRRSELEPIAMGANSEKRTEDIGSAPGALSRKDAEAILRWRDDLDNTRFPVDLQAIV
ncbi:MAG: carbon storage regulator, partial [Caulobacteraceae bacterium]|nr:carbon storage regulator [Caulobacteraceae bacterium]